MADETDGTAVKFTIKELLLQVSDRLKAIEDKLDGKANKELVDVLAQKIESVATRIPQELIKEHAQLLIQLELQKQHNEWADGQIAALVKWQSSAVSVKALIVPILALVVTVAWTTFSIVNAVVVGHTSVAH